MDGNDGVFTGAHQTRLAAAVDDFLGAALHFGVAPLYRGVVQFFMIGAAAPRGSRTASHPDPHGRTAQDHHQGPRRGLLLMNVRFAHGAHPTGNHDGFVIAPMVFTGLFKTAEITQHRGAAEFVVERCRPDRRLKHDLKGRSQSLGPFELVLPGLDVIRDSEIGNRKPGHAGLGPRAPTGSGAVADFTPCARGGARERRNGGGMIVRLHLDTGVRRLFHTGVLTLRPAYKKACGGAACNYRSVVYVGRKQAVGTVRGSLPDQVKKGLGKLLLSVPPIGVENLVAAVLGIDLRKHHQLGVGWIASQFPESLFQVGDFLRGQCQGHLPGGLLQCRAALQEQRNRTQSLRWFRGKQLIKRAILRDQLLGHSVEQLGFGVVS